MSTDEQRDLSDTSSANNQRDGITGVLTYRSGFILQILEGSEGAVRDLLLKIRQDTRHKNIDVLRETFIDRRQFTGWNMRLTTPAEILQPDSAIFQKLFQDNDESRDSYSIEAETLFILSTFSRDGRRAFT